MNRHQITALTYSSDKPFTTAHHRQHSYLNGKHPIHTETSISHRNTSLHTETALFTQKYPCSRGKRRQICRRIHTNRTKKETFLLKNGQQSFQAAATAPCNGGWRSACNSHSHAARAPHREASRLLMRNEQLSHSASSQSSKTHSAAALSLEVGARTKCEWIQCTKVVLFFATDCSCQRYTH